MRPVTVSQTGTGATAAVPLDHYLNPFSVGVGVVVGGNTVTVQGTYDNPFASTPATWIDLVGFVGLTSNTAAVLSVPVTAVRVNVTVGSGTTTVTFLQAGMPGG